MLGPWTLEDLELGRLQVKVLVYRLQYSNLCAVTCKRRKGWCSRESDKMYHFARNGYTEAPSSTTANPNRTL